jgi:hypothetical protein
MVRAVGTRCSLSEWRRALDQTAKSCKIARRARVERFPCGERCIIELEDLSVCEHPPGRIACLCDHEVGQVRVAGGDGAVNEVALLGSRAEIHTPAPAP